MASLKRIYELMGASKLDQNLILKICAKGNPSDPYQYFWKAVMTEQEHGRAGEVIGTNVIKTNDDAAKIVIAHLMGVESGKAPEEWVVCPNYYNMLWKSEIYCDKDSP